MLDTLSIVLEITGAGMRTDYLCAVVPNLRGDTLKAGPLTGTIGQSMAKNGVQQKNSSDGKTNIN